MSSSNESKKSRRSQSLRSHSNKKSGTKSKQSRSKKRKASSSNSSNSNNNSQSKKRKTSNPWKVGDKVRPLGMPTHYVIKRSVNKNTWEMEHFDGRYRDLIPKVVEDPKSGWSKL